MLSLRLAGEIGAIPTVRIVIAEGNEDMTIKIADEGGGIPRSEMPKVWTYLHSTAQRPDSMTGGADQTRTAALAGYGVGMPLSRLYAEYFGGSMDVISMESIGTDVYLHLNRLGEKCEHLPQMVTASPGNMTSEMVEEEEDTSRKLTQKEQTKLFYQSGLASN